MFPDKYKSKLKDVTFYALNESTGEYEKVGRFENITVSWTKPVTYVRIKLKALLALIVCTLKGDNNE